MTARSKDIEGVAANYTQQYPGMCRGCGKAVTLIIERNPITGYNQSRYYLTPESDLTASAPYCECGKLFKDTFAKI